MMKLPTAFLIVALSTPVTLGFAPSLSLVTGRKNSALSASTEQHATEVNTDDDAWVAFDFNNNDDVDHTEIPVGNNNWLVADFEAFPETPPQATESTPKRVHDWFPTASLDSSVSLKKVQTSSAFDTAGGNEWFSTTSAPAAPTGTTLSVKELVSHKPIAMAPSQTQSADVSPTGTSSWFQSASPDNINSKKSVGLSSFDSKHGVNEWFSQTLFSPKEKGVAHKVASLGGWFTQAIRSGSTPGATAAVTTTGLSRGPSSWLATSAAPSVPKTIHSQQQGGPNEWFSSATPPATLAAPLAAAVVEPSRKTHDWFAGAVPDASTTDSLPVYENEHSSNMAPREWFMAAILN